MARIIRTSIKIKYYDNWAGYLMYLSICGIATAGLGLVMNYEIAGTDYYNQIVIAFGATLMSALVFGVISREIAMKKPSKHNSGGQFGSNPYISKAKPNYDYRSNPYSTTFKQRSNESYQKYKGYTETESEKDARIRENIKKGIIHL